MNRAYAKRSHYGWRHARVIAFSLFLCGSSLAAPVSRNYLCVQGHEQEAANKLQAFVRQAVTDFFKDRRIAVNPATLQVNLSSSIQTGYDAAPYIAFTGTSAGTAVHTSSVAATIAAQDGTKFNVLLSSGSDNQDAAEYRAISTQRGFDREGNAIQQHCTLKLFNSDDSEATKNLLVINAGSGHALGLIRLVPQISLY
jgi:hypothetical protein